MDEHYQAGTEGLKYAAKKGLGIVVMEPIRGGLLAKDIAGISEIWQKAESTTRPAEWALRWVWNHPEVTSRPLRHVDAWSRSGRMSPSHRAGLQNSLTKTELAAVSRK